jgi:lipoprotein-releasing system permease protein
MLIIDKREDILTLQSMGADQSLIRRIFLWEGWLISILGAFLGLILGFAICWVQIKFQLLKFPGNGSFAVPAYPVEIHTLDLLLTFITVLLIGFIVSWLPVRFISGKYINTAS